MSDRYELILEPRVKTISADDTKLKSDLQSLQRTVNKDSPLKLSLSADIPQSVSRLKSDLKNIKPQLDNVLKISVGLDASSATKLSTSTGTKSTGAKTLTEEATQVQRVNQEYSKLKATLKEVNEIELKIARLDSSKNVTQITELNHQLEIAKEKYNTLYSSVMEDPASKQILTQKQLILFENERLKGENAVKEVLAKQADLAEKVKQAQELSSSKVEQRTEALQSRIDRAKVSWSKMLGDPGIMSQISEIEAELKNVQGDPAKLNDVNRKWQILSNNISEAGKNQQSFGDKVASTWSRLSAYLANVVLYTAVLNNVKNAVQAVKDLDLSLTEIRKVSDLSSEALLKFTDRAFDAAGQIGRTGKDLIDATAEFRRAGYELESAFAMGQASLVMTNVADGINSVEEASSALIAVLRGFKMPESSVMSVVDSINQVSNKAPITFRDLTEGMRRVSGTLAQTGDDINQVMGLLTGGFAQLRDVESVSSALVFISQRLRGVGEDGEAIEGLAPRLAKDFKEIADIDIADANGELRSTYSILDDMARIFPTLTSQQRQYLSEQAAGNRNVKTLNAILSGWDDVENAVENAINSQGSALEENSKFMDSIEGKTQKLQSSFQAMSNSTIDSDIIKTLLDISNGFVNFLNIGDGSLAKFALWTAGIAGFSAALKSVTATKFGENFLGFFKDVGRLKNTRVLFLGMLPDLSCVA